jgi:hypothetical protein
MRLAWRRCGAILRPAHALQSLRQAKTRPRRRAISPRTGGAVQPDLNAIVLVVSNDPDDLLNPDNDSDTDAKVRRRAQRAAQLKKACGR